MTTNRNQSKAAKTGVTELLPSLFHGLFKKPKPIQKVSLGYLLYARCCFRIRK